MAAFRTHFTVGIFVGYLAGALGVIYDITVAPFSALYVFIGTSIGAILPDLDSDHSKPFAIVFGLLSLLGGMFAFGYCLQHYELHQWRHWLWIPPLAALFVRYGVGKVFQEFTVHRGIFHSIPMVLIMVGMTAILLEPLRLNAQDQIALSVSVGLGFLTHLVLDEVYAAVDFDGLSIGPKKSFGTALTLFAPSSMVTAAAYTTLAGLVALNWPLIKTGIQIWAK